MGVALSQCLVKTMKTLGNDPGTSGTKPESTCPSGAQQCFSQVIWCQEWAANYQSICVPGSWRQLQYNTNDKDTGSKQVRHNILSRVGAALPCPRVFIAATSHINPNTELGQKLDKNEKPMWRREQSTRQWLKKLHTKISQQRAYSICKVSAPFSMQVRITWMIFKLLF